MATIVVFANAAERAGHCAEYGHDFANQPKIFCSETDKLLNLCDELYKNAIYARDKEKETKLLMKIFGIAKKYHARIVWYGKGNGACEPDRFLVVRSGKDLALIQC